jgi:imidazolonepropionase
MPLTLLTHARQLLTLRGPARARRGKEMGDLGIVPDGWLLFEDDRILAAGSEREIRELLADRKISEPREMDCSGRVVAPGFVDSHTHAVFDRPRLDDFERRCRGESYEQIARSGGGIMETVRRVHAASDEELARRCRESLAQALALGTTTIEIKSGYGLTPEHEIRLLRIAAGVVAESSGAPAGVLTLLAAHALPEEFAGRREAYVEAITSDLLPAAAAAGPARPKFVDVFCERIAFSIAECDRILRRARELDFELKLHADQLSRTGAAALGVRLGATSVDHLDWSSDADQKLLARSNTVATLLPGPSLFLNGDWVIARPLIDAGAAVALATDFNPGSSPTVSMPLMMSLACTRMKMTAAEAWTAATINGAAALGLVATVGSLQPGTSADILILEASDYREIPYWMGRTDIAAATISRGSIGAGEALPTR